MKSTSLSTKLIMILLLLAVIGYFAVQGYNYLVSPETTTLVYRYRSEQSIAVRGCVVRKEQVVDCGETLIELKHAEGERVGQGDTIAAVYRSAEALSATQELESLARRKSSLNTQRALRATRRPRCASTPISASRSFPCARPMSRVLTARSTRSFPSSRRRF